MFAVAVPGVRFVVLDSDDAIVFTAIKPPRLNEYEILMRAGRRRAKEAGLKRRDLERAIGRVWREMRAGAVTPGMVVKRSDLSRDNDVGDVFCAQLPDLPR